MTTTTDVQREMWQAWSATADAAKAAGELLDREEFDEVTWLMLVEARDLISKAMRREGFSE